MEVAFEGLILAADDRGPYLTTMPPGMSGPLNPQRSSQEVGSAPVRFLHCPTLSDGGFN